MAHTYHTRRINNVRGEMNLSKPNRLVVGVLYGRIVVVRERPAHEGIGEGSFAHRSKTEDGNLSMHERWIGAVWHC